MPAKRFDYFPEVLAVHVFLFVGFFAGLYLLIDKIVHFKNSKPCGNREDGASSTGEWLYEKASIAYAQVKQWIERLKKRANEFFHTNRQTIALVEIFNYGGFVCYVAYIFIRAGLCELHNLYHFRYLDRHLFGPLDLMTTWLTMFVQTILAVATFILVLFRLYQFSHLIINGPDHGKAKNANGQEITPAKLDDELVLVLQHLFGPMLKTPCSNKDCDICAKLGPVDVDSNQSDSSTEVNAPIISTSSDLEMSTDDQC
ncbi:hypothetical protein EJ04DRAFT_569954 [Polyplosphaeria fusca]|uniref:Uncharacterized protein n=1 Tax=Polyplosphaeria fusca TaxID=682080 RepID=A0A9P4QNC9_9PLEO|nr:hypothetical protein EJ04DRAFT_569954 [Polyplosphaeria fusca]